MEPSRIQIISRFWRRKHVGDIEGAKEGILLGEDDGLTIGDFDGTLVDGLELGDRDGDLDGLEVDGERDGDLDGFEDVDTATGAFDGCEVIGDREGDLEGFDEGFKFGDLEGLEVDGDFVGPPGSFAVGAEVGGQINIGTPTVWESLLKHLSPCQ